MHELALNIHPMRSQDFVGVYRFLTNLDPDTKENFHPPLVYPAWRGFLSFVFHVGLFLSAITLLREILFRIGLKIAFMPIVVFLGARVHGFGYLRLMSRIKGGYKAELGIVTSPASRGRGLGEHLITTLLQECRKYRIAKISLTVFPTNTPAMRLYEKHGFHLVEMSLDKSERDIREELRMELCTNQNSGCAFSQLSLHPLNSVESGKTS